MSAPGDSAQLQDIWTLFMIIDADESCTHHPFKPEVVCGMRLIRRPWKDCCFWYVADLPLLTCCTCSLLLSRRGVRGADKVLDDFKTGSKELVAVVDMTFSYAQQGSLITLLTTVRQGPGTLLPLLTFCTCSLMLNREADNVLDNCKTGHTELACRCWHVAHVRLCSTGGADNVLDDSKTGSTELVAESTLALMLRDVRKRNRWASEDCTWNMKITIS